MEEKQGEYLEQKEVEFSNPLLRLDLGLFKKKYGIFLVIQWLRLHAPNAGNPGLIPAQGTRSCMCN